jgi:hypothetical protein
MNRFDRAEEIQDNGQPVFDVAETWYQNAEYYAEFTEDEPNPEPFVFASKRTRWTLRIDWEGEAERFQDFGCFEDPEDVDLMFGRLKGREELQAAVDRFNDLNSGIVFYDDPDFKRKIRVKRGEG